MPARRPLLVRLAAVSAMALSAAAAATAAAPETAHAARCGSFVYEVNFGPIRVHALRTTRISCRRAKRLIRAGSPPASSYNWIESYRCGPGYGGRGYLCRRGKRTIRWKWRMAGSSSVTTQTTSPVARAARRCPNVIIRSSGGGVYNGTRGLRVRRARCRTARRVTLRYG